jgi:Zn-dependent protease with chaperone function
MRHEQYAALVKRVEAYAAAHPAAYATRVVLLAAAGYGFAGFMMLVIVAIFSGMGWLVSRVSHDPVMGIVWPIVVLGVALAVIGRVFWVGFATPSAVPLRARDAPGLIALVQMLTTRLRTPRLHRILLTTADNVGIGQRPRLGPFGWYHNSLALGLPVLQALAPDEFRAVLAHELGHLSRQHGRFGSWIYRIRVLWQRLAARPPGDRQSGFVAHWFLKRWGPLFSAYTLVLARRQEYDADQFAAQLAGKNVLARGLARLEVLRSFLQQQWWPAVLAQAKADPEPPAGIMGSMAPALRAGPIPADARRWLEQALRRRTSHTDSHPSLADRLAALGVTAEPVLAQGQAAGSLSAAEFHFGKTLPALESQLSALWVREVRRAWHQRHEQAARARQQLAELTTTAAVRPLRTAEEWDVVQRELELDGAGGALPRLWAFVQRVPDHEQARYALGSVLLERDDPSGVEHIAWVCEREPEARIQGYDMLSRFCERHGRYEEAEAYMRQAWVAADLIELALAERQMVEVRDQLLPHGLTPDEVQRLRQALERVPVVKAAYIARKDVHHLPEKPYYIVAVEMRLRWYWKHTAAQGRPVIGQALQALSLRGPWRVLCGRLDYPYVWRKIKRVPGAELLRR